MSISANLVIRNESNRLQKLLPILREQVDEIVVVDQESTDDSLTIAKDFGCITLSDTATGFADTSRELARQNSSSDWIICLDADEFITNRLAEDFSLIYGWGAISAVYLCEAILRVKSLDELPTETILTLGHDLRGLPHISLRKARIFLNNKDAVVWPTEVHTEILPAIETGLQGFGIQL